MKIAAGIQSQSSGEAANRGKISISSNGSCILGADPGIRRGGYHTDFLTATPVFIKTHP